MEPLFAQEEGSAEESAVFETHLYGEGDFVSNEKECRWESLSREAVLHYAEKGPAALLGDLVLRRYPEFREEGFIGWLIEDIRDPCMKHVFKKDDVLVSVNGTTLNTPSDFWNLWRELLSLDEIRLEILRKDDRLEMVFPFE